MGTKLAAAKRATAAVATTSIAKWPRLGTRLLIGLLAAVSVFIAASRGRNRPYVTNHGNTSAARLSSSCQPRHASDTRRSYAARLAVWLRIVFTSAFVRNDSFGH